MKILLVIASPELVRNYLGSTALDSLTKTHDVSLLIHDRLNLENIDTNNLKKIFIFTDEGNLFQSRLIQDMYMIRYRHLSEGFMYRVQRKYKPIRWEIIQASDYLLAKCRTSISSLKLLMRVGSYRFYGNVLRFCVAILRLILSIPWLAAIALKRQIIRAVMRLISSRLLFWLLIKPVLLLRPTNSSIREAIYCLKPDLVLYPSSAYEPYLIDIVSNTKSVGAKSMMLIDNWDNLSSKTVISHKPDFVATWGEQSTLHAIHIQGFKRANCFNLGTPRIDPYFYLLNASLPSPYSFRYVLVLGSSAPYGEIGFIKKLDEQISSNFHLYGDLKIIYRPHPLRYDSEVINLETFKVTFFDSEVSGMDLSKDGKFGRMPSLPKLSNYPNLIKNAELIISGITSMMIEASIFNKRCFVMGFDEPRNMTSPAKMLELYPHFRGINALPNLSVSSDHHSLLNDVELFFLSNCPIKEYEIESINYFIFHDEEPYPTRLLHLIEKLVPIP